MQQYLDLVADTLAGGGHKPNRTGVDTIASFSQQYKVDLQEGFPLLTTKDLSGFRWNSLIHEFKWYLSGEEHIRNLREETGIWDAWADEEGRLDTAYGRFWRRFPVPDEGLDGEAWPDDDHQWRNDDGTFDQIQYVVDTLNESPNSRRLVVSAWHPANAAVSTLPPCHYTFVFNVQGDQLNCHLTQRSGDIALGVPFNIAAYSLLTHAVAQETGFEVGEFGHTVVDAHVYCGTDARGDWYADNLDRLQERLAGVESRADYLAVRDWLETEAPDETEETEGYDHVPGLLTQLSREPRSRPRIEIADKPLDSLDFEDIELLDYDPADGISFAVAE
ncbi:thymidylate synthase [Halonotius roseus]|uniref:Thymidylate synthase n=1 Tax=Halonotius roseus TaxID=2511997 RepID=A0A544QKW9_9EURY|nr:thymidylate synthase [Halonotius roseus]TQQ79009.1 thymidylate synthase [Halonotius roseus]